MKPSSGFEQTAEIYHNRPRRAKALQAKGRKILGYIGSNTPLEILTSFDLVPYRILGDMEEPITEADAVLPVSLCPFMRSCFDLALKGRYKFLDGIVGAHFCDAQEKTILAWKSKITYPLFFYLDMPHTTHTWSQTYFKSLLIDFAGRLASFTGRSLSEDRLRESIDLHNRQRRRLKDLYALRQSDPPLVSGSEVIRLMVALGSIPVQEGNDLLQRTIREATSRLDRPSKKSARILVWGDCLGSVHFTDVIETYANLVMDDICLFSLNHCEETSLADESFDALAKRYLRQSTFPRTFRESRVGETLRDHRTNLTTRFGYLREYIEKWQVNGVVLLLTRNCDPHGYEVPAMKRFLEDIGLPSIYLEHLYSDSGIEGLKTRIQAFVEMIG